MVKALPKIQGIGRIRGGKDANFILVEILKDGEPDNAMALAVYERLAEKKSVVVRFRGKEHGCLGCLRVTVGTEHEVDKFLENLESTLDDLAGRSPKAIRKVDSKTEEAQEVQASKVVA